MRTIHDTSSADPAASPLPAWLGSARLPVYFAVAVALCAAVIGLATPGFIPAAFLEENGPVETATIYFYLAAAACVLLMRLPSASIADKAALGIVLLACAAREADLHKELFGISILKSRFFLQATPWQMAVALSILLPIVAAVAFLIVRHRASWRVRPSRWTPAVTAAATFFALMVASKIFDRTPDSFPGMSTVFLFLLQSEEEVLEMALPQVVLLATFQAAWLARRQPFPWPGPLVSDSRVRRP
jgi:hypothetical protein